MLRPLRYATRTMCLPTANPKDAASTPPRSPTPLGTHARSRPLRRLFQHHTTDASRHGARTRVCRAAAAAHVPEQTGSPRKV